MAPNMSDTNSNLNSPPPTSSQTTDSLIKRLAGPSTGKAGLANDQTAINQIIADASKGSKFYENEKRKDKLLTDRIERILKQRDEILKQADMAKAEAAADRILAELEEHRDFSQTIIHVDMDAFFANVELRDNPDLAGKTFGVGFGVLTTASYEARKFGVRSGMPGFIAKKLCPQLILVPNRHRRYAEMSDRVMAIFRRYDPNMCAAGCDEGYLNITEYCRTHALGPEECVQQMRRTVFEETQLTVSAGIAPNKMLAKICSDKNKPNGQFTLPFTREAVLDFVRDLSIRKIPGIGRVSERMLDSLGIKTCGDIYTYRATLLLLENTNAFDLRWLLRIHLGIASNEVRPWEREERKSMGAERTFNALSDREKILNKLDEIATELAGDLERGAWGGKTITLKYKTDAFQIFTRAKSFTRLITSKEELFSIGKELLLHEGPLTLRLIGLRATKLKDLREPEVGSGIMRFLKPAQASPASPSKRRKFDHSHDDGMLPRLGDDLEATVSKMWEESDEEAIDDDPIEKMDGDSSTWQRPGSSESGSASLPSSSANLECPICGKVFAGADNAKLNDHIDFCLSKQAILDAQASAVSVDSSSAVGRIGNAGPSDGQQRNGKRKREVEKKEEFKSKGLKKGKGRPIVGVEAFFKPRSVGSKTT